MNGRWVGKEYWGRTWFKPYNAPACRLTIIEEAGEFVIIDDPDGAFVEVKDAAKVYGRFPCIEAAKVAYMLKASAEGLI